MRFIRAIERKFVKEFVSHTLQNDKILFYTISQSLIVLMVLVVLTRPVWAENTAGLITKIQGKVTTQKAGEEKPAQ